VVAARGERGPGRDYTAGPGIDITGNSISVANLGVTGAMLAPAAVGAGKIAANTVTRAEIVDRTVDTADIAVGAVTNSELASYAVGPNKIAAGVVGASEIATDAVGSAEIAAGAVGESEIATGAVRRSKIDGAEVGLYTTPDACGAGLTFASTCTTNFCSPLPVPLYWTCNHDCLALAPQVCSNNLRGYLLSPNIQ
jgi:hypothetical protein